MKKSELRKMVAEELLREDATGQFNKHVTSAKTLLAAIGKQIDKMAKEQKADPKNWGYAGSMEHVADSLKDVFKFISGQED